jgi:hypothetical protein
MRFEGSKAQAAMHLTMVKKILADGSDCRKCAEASAYLQSRGLWDRVDEVVLAHEGDADSPGMRLGRRLGADSAPFFVIRDERGETVYTSVLQLVRDRLGEAVTAAAELAAIDPDDIGGI